jgi:hypothetical protein
MVSEKRKLSAEVVEQPHVDGDQIKLLVAVLDENTGQRWNIESNLTGAPSKTGSIPFEVAKAVEDLVYAYLAKDGVAAKVRQMRAEITPHKLGVTYRPTR